MPVRNLDKILRPKQIALIGASEEPGKVGTTLLRNLVSSDFLGAIYPVNHRRSTVQGLVSYPSVVTLPVVADLAIIATPAATVPALVRECGEAGVRGLMIISAGFREVGAAGRELENQVHAELRKFDGMRIVGPNCMGLIVPGANLNATFALGMPQNGRVAFISQSGALCSAVLDWAIEERIGFSFFASIGNVIDVGIPDLLDYLAEDPQTESVILYVESIEKSREFMSAARAFSRNKPILAYKAGRFVESAHAASSHTGALAGVDAVYAAAFQRAGIVRVFESAEIFQCAELLARQPQPHGPRLAIVTNAGGPGVMATDSLIAAHGQLATLSDETIRALNAALPSFWSHGNPVDLLGDAPPERFAAATAQVLRDDNVDALLIMLSPQAMTDPTASADAVCAAAQGTSKPVLTAWMGAERVRVGIERLNRAGIPNYSTPEQAIRAFMDLVTYARNQELLNETPRDVPISFTPARQRLREHWSAIPAATRETLSEDVSKALLEAYQIPTTRPFPARTPDEAVSLAHTIGYPVVLKVLSPQITHKTDVGGVALNIAFDEDVVAAFSRIIATAQQHCPEAAIEGVTVQRMVTAVNGFEMILGAKQDPVFGAVILAGLGGIAAEVFQDWALELPPLNERLAQRMLHSLRSWPLLAGYRGRPGVCLDRLVEILIRFSYLVADYPEIKEVDINPLLVTADDLVALDARIVVEPPATGRVVQLFSHLAIRPYPEEFVRPAQLVDGTRLVLRPIKPEDGPQWQAFLSGCSHESLRSRFRYTFREATQQMAARFCFIDYDRELAIVAELGEGAERRIIGVGRLVADPDHRTAEYAVLLTDTWQGKGIGALLTDYCLEICQRWNIRRLRAETAPDNVRMIQILKSHSFEFSDQSLPDTLVAHKVL